MSRPWSGAYFGEGEKWFANDKCMIIKGYSTSKGERECMRA